MCKSVTNRLYGFNQLADPRWQCPACTNPFMFKDSFFNNATNSTHNEIDTTDISACTDSDADTSSSDYTSTNISTNSGDELCGIDALSTIRKQNRRNVIISHLNINSLPDKFVHIEDALINEPVEFLCVS